MGPASTSPEHFMVELWKPCLVPPGLAEQEQASPECFLEWNHVALLGICEWCVLFWRKKYSHLGVAPEPLAIWNKELEGLWILYCSKIADLKKSFEWCALFWRKSALTECSPRASCYLEQRVGWSWIWVVQRTKNLSCCSPWALFKKNSDTGSWHVLW